MKIGRKSLAIGTVLAGLALANFASFASSHMDAPLITLDDAANTTDVYAFRSQGGGQQNLTVALAVYPFEEPGIGPNNYRFDDNVLYEIHVALDDDIDQGRKTLSYQFSFDTRFKDPNTTLQAFLGPISCASLDQDGFDVNQNLRQTYQVTRVDYRGDDEDGESLKLGSGRVPPNNQGLVTPVYNTAGGEGPAKGGVSSEAQLDSCTRFGINPLASGYRSFAGQRDDGFYADIQSIFDLDFTFTGVNKPFDSQGGYNVHTIVLEIPLSELGGAQRAGVYATTSRLRSTKLNDGEEFEENGDKLKGGFVQVARQGNPLFNEALVSLARKDLYNRTEPTRDFELFFPFAQDPELGSNDVSSVFIPDLIRVDLTTPPVPLAGPPDQAGFSRLSVFGGDTVPSGLSGSAAGGFPNGRRFGDDVLDIAFLALGIPNFDGVDANDISYNRVFPYAATPLNGRNHPHH